MRTCNSYPHIARTLLLLKVLLAATPKMAAAIALTPTGGSVSTGYTDRLEVGARFSVSTQLAVTGLGYYDSGSDGLLSPHIVTLWDDAGNMIASATISTLSPLDGGTFDGGQFRFAPIIVSLEPGIYRLSGRLEANSFADPLLFDNFSPGDAPDTSAGIQFLGRAYAPDGSRAGAFPSVVGAPGIADSFGPNMLVTPVPEPSSLSLALFALAVGLRYRRRMAELPKCGAN